MNERLFSPLIEEPVDEAALRQARAEVLARLGRSRRGGPLRLAWVAAAVAVLVWSGRLMIPPVPDGSPIERAVLASLPQPPSAPAPVRATRLEEPKTASPPAEHPLVEQVRVNPAPPNDETAPDGVILKLASSNPDVILYWLMDEQGD